MEETANFSFRNITEIRLVTCVVQDFNALRGFTHCSVRATAPSLYMLGYHEVWRTQLRAQIVSLFDSSHASEMMFKRRQSLRAEPSPGGDHVG